MQLLVKTITETCAGVRTLELVHPGCAPLPPFSAGAHIDVTLPNGVTRQYSLSNNPEEKDRYVIGVLLDKTSRGGSHWIHHMLEEGSLLEAGEPRNLFPMENEQQEAVLMGGGIGITPLLSMAHTCLERGIPFTLHYVVCGREKTAFREVLEEAAVKPHVRMHYGRPDGNLLPDLIGAADTGKYLYVCGPEGFMEAVSSAALDSGWASGNIRRENFKHDTQAEADNEAFQVRIGSSGEIIDIPAGQSISQTLDARGYFIPVSCEQGICGSCVTPILEGEADHRDCFLTDEEKQSNRMLTPCCSRAKSRMLVLDL